jgi:hypothetical protein
MFLQLNHQKPDVYSFSKAFVLEFYKLTKFFPLEEKYELMSQIR